MIVVMECHVVLVSAWQGLGGWSCKSNSIFFNVGRVKLTRESRICSLLPLRAFPPFEIWGLLVWLTAVRRMNPNRPNGQLRGLTDHRLKLPVQQRSV
jgi:hypothetical protein